MSKFLIFISNYVCNLYDPNIYQESKRFQKYFKIRTGTKLSSRIRHPKHIQSSSRVCYSDKNKQHVSETR